MKETCAHCKGEGTCRQDSGTSCESCLDKAGAPPAPFIGRIVKCGSCDGKGYHMEQISYPMSFGKKRFN